MGTPAPSPGLGRKLPPLILHPFSDPHAPETLAASARASLILHGMLPAEDAGVEELNRRFLEGCYYEVKMLYYLGKDLTRWLGQCMEVVRRDGLLRSRGLEPESFAELLVKDAPEVVRQKMLRWGVVDYQALFRRALGLHAVFAAVPEQEALSDSFLKHHHRYADTLYECRLRNAPHNVIAAGDFSFEIYASGEYARLLEQEWSGDRTLL